MTKEVKQALFVLIGALLAAGVIGYFVQQDKTELDRVNGEIAKLNKEIVDLEKEVAKRPALQAELASIKANLSQYITILPSKEVATEERLYELIHDKTQRAQFVVDEITMVEKGGAKAATRGKGKSSRKSKGSAFQELTVSVRAEATFDQFLLFLNSLERHETFLRVNSFNCNSQRTESVGQEEGIWPLTIDLSVSTFRYQPGS